MQNLLPEHVLLAASFLDRNQRLLPERIVDDPILDGDSYVNFACTNKDNYQLFNAKTFLQQVYNLNKYQFLVLDARYYAYCYAEHFLIGRKLR